MSWCWLALLAELPGDAEATARAWHLDGTPAGALAAWTGRVKPRHEARRIEGALTVARGPDAARLGDDPFARVFPGRVLRVEAGLLGRTRWPAGPVIERYGSARPWPSDRF